MYSSQRQLIENDHISAEENHKLDSDHSTNHENIPSKVLHINQSHAVENELEGNTKNNLPQSSIHNNSNLQKTNVYLKEKRQSNLGNLDISYEKCIENLEMTSSHSSIESNASQHTKSSSTTRKNRVLDSHSPHESKSEDPENKFCKEDNENADRENKIRRKQKKRGNLKTDEIEMKDLKIKETDYKSTHYFIGVHILGTELLQNHLHHCFPFVKLHIIDNKSGKYLTNDNMKELKTNRYDLHQNSSIIPYWDEILLFDDLLTKSLTLVEKLLFVFEVINDHQSSEEAIVDKRMDTIAWAFIKPISMGGYNYINRKLKLQLYKPNNTRNSQAWWKNKPWEIYPSVLNVVIKSLRQSETQDFIDSIKLSLLQNIHEKNTSFLQSTVHRGDERNLTTRLRGQHCAIPNKIVKCINIEKCSNIIKFSQCGCYLACGVLQDSKQFVLIFTVPQFLEKAKLSSHRNIIYDICWSTANRLITSSADCTACLWDITNANKNLLQRIFHPAFVYSSKFCPINENVVVTGCYDKIVRVWTSTDSTDSINYSLHQELTGHGGFVNAICFVARSDMFYSGDSAGIIIKWTHSKGSWIKVLLIDEPQFKHKIINDLQIFPDNHRILVVMRNSPSWTFDIATSTAFTCYKDGIDSKYQVRGVISPCGTLVFIGNNIWSASTGHLLAIYNPSAYDHHSIMTIDYHPHYFLMAIGCGLNGSPLLCCEYQEGLTTDRELKLGLEIMTPSFQYPELTKNSIIQPNTPHKITKDTLKANRKHHFTKIITKSLNVEKNCKLQTLINKMDDAILMSGCRNKDEIMFENELLSDNVNSKSNNTDSDISGTYKVDLTEFHRKMKLHEKLPTAPLSFRLNKSSDEDTYTVEKEISIKTFTKDPHTNNDSSSNFSNAESLENDMNTYSIS